MFVPPYLQLTKLPSEMLVQWVGDAKASYSVKMGSSVAKEQKAIGLVTPGKVVRRFLLRGLPINRDFQYVIASGQKQMTFTGHGSRSATEASRLAIFGDSGRGLPGQRLMGKQLAKYDPDLIVHTGDIIYPDGRERDYFKFHFPVYGDILSRTPSVYAAGNHDTAYRDLKRIPDGLAYYKLWSGIGSKLPFAKDVGNFSFSYGAAFWVILDSNPYTNWNSPAAKTWLRTELAKGAGAKWRFVAFHHPPYHSSKKKEKEVHMQAVAPIFEAMKVTAVFNGHVHNYQRSVPIGPAGRGPVYIVTGAGGAELYDQKIAKTPTLWKKFTAKYLTGYSFTSLIYDAKSCRLQQIDSQGKVIDQVRFTR
jgi:acid phosphatase type 7